MTKWSLLTSNLTVTTRIIPTALSLVLASGSAFAATSPSGASTAAMPSKDPLVSSAGYIYQLVPQVEGKDQKTVLGATLDINLVKTQRTQTIFEIELEGSKTYAKSEDASKAVLVTNQYYVLQTYQTDDADTSVTYGLTAALPANDADREAGMENAVGADLSLATKLGPVGILLATEYLSYNYQWDTSTTSGDEYNNKSSMLYVAKAKIPLSQRFAWRWKATAFQYTNFANNTYTNGALSTNILFKPTPSIGTYIGMSSRNRMDKVVSSQKQLSREMVNITVGLEWSI